MATEPGTAATTLPSLIISGLALAFSIFNLYYTSRTARTLRRASLKRDAFNSTIRTPVERALDEINADTVKLKALTRSYRSLDEIKTELNELAKGLTDKSERLFDILTSADEQKYWNSQQGWYACTQDPWDEFLSAVDVAGQKAISHDVAKTQIGRACSALKTLDRTLRSRINHEQKIHIDDQ